MPRILLRFFVLLLFVAALVAAGLVVLRQQKGALREDDAQRSGAAEITGSARSLAAPLVRGTVVPEVLPGLALEGIPFPQFRNKKNREVGAPVLGVDVTPVADIVIPELVKLDGLVRAAATAEAVGQAQDGVPTATAVSPELEALRELGEIHGGGGAQNFDVDSSRIFGARVRTPERAVVAGPDVATPEPTATTVPLLGRVTGQARGFVLLPLMHPKARESAEVQLNTMLRAEIQELYVSVLVDNTFGTDLGYLTEVVERLNAGGRSLTLAIYLTNGPTMRRFDTTTIETAFSWINPIDFRDLIQHDRTVRDRFQRIARAVNPVWELNSRLNPLNRNIALVMLEDNLDARSYQAMRRLAAEVVPKTVEFVRNPCPGCYEGNDRDSGGDAVEVHAPAALDRIGTRDGYTLDGAGYGYADGRRTPEWDIDRLKAALDQSVAQGVSYFGLWRASRQGNYSQDFAHPDERVYEVPTAEQVEIDISLLRHGLRAVEE